MSPTAWADGTAIPLTLSDGEGNQIHISVRAYHELPSGRRMDAPERSAADVRAKLDALEAEHDRLLRRYHDLQVLEATSAPEALRLPVVGYCECCGDVCDGHICLDCLERAR